MRKETRKKRVDAALIALLVACTAVAILVARGHVTAFNGKSRREKLIDCKTRTSRPVDLARCIRAVPFDGDWGKVG